MPTQKNSQIARRTPHAARQGLRLFDISFKAATCALLLTLGFASTQAQTTNTNGVAGGGTINSGTTGLITDPITTITGAITNNGLLLFQQSYPSTRVTDSNIISGTGAFTQAGQGTVVLTGLNTFTGTTTITNDFFKSSTLVLSNTTGPALYNGGSGTLVMYSGNSQATEIKGRYEG